MFIRRVGKCVGIKSESLSCDPILMKCFDRTAASRYSDGIILHNNAKLKLNLF